jgi:hypothetical protein
VAEHRQALGDGLGAADDVEDEVEPFCLLVARVRRSEPASRLELALVQVERVDLRGTGHPGALDH